QERPPLQSAELLLAVQADAVAQRQEQSAENPQDVAQGSHGDGSFSRPAPGPRPGWRAEGRAEDTVRTGGGACQPDGAGANGGSRAPAHGNNATRSALVWPKAVW